MRLCRPLPVAAHDALLQTYNDLLVRLIGATLTARLLRCAAHADDAAHGPRAQDAPP